MHSTFGIPIRLSEKTPGDESPDYMHAKEIIAAVSALRVNLDELLHSKVEYVYFYDFW